MSVRFVIGRAGTGKTHHCIESMRAELRSDPVGGPRLLLLVPEQAGLQMERAIIDPRGGCPAAHRADVVSFERLAARVLGEAAGPQRVALSEAARAMVLRDVLAANSQRLKYYRRAARMTRGGMHVTGLIERLVKSVSELLEEAIEPAELRNCSGSAAVRGNPAQSAKLHDLAVVYEAYLEYLGERWLDPARRLELARARLGDCGWLCGAQVWVDGFASFSGQERAMLVELSRLAAHVDITALVDPADIAAAGSSAGSPRPALFAKSLRTHGELIAAMAEAGLLIEDPLRLDPEVPPRFARRPALARLEANLFRSGNAESSGACDFTGAIELKQAASRRVEVDYAVSRIVGWVRGDGLAAPYRYRDVAIIVRDLEEYHELVGEALEARGIPFFIDRRRSVTHHPLVELLRTLIGVATDDMSLDRVRQLLRCGLVGLAPAGLDELENYLIEHGIEGTAVWLEPTWRHVRVSSAPERTAPASVETDEKLVRVEAVRAEVIRWLRPWLEFACGSDARDGGEWREAIHRLFQSLGVAAQLAQWSDDAEAHGAWDLAEEHREVWKQVCALLDDLAFVFDDRALSSVEVQEVLEAGLSQLTLGLVPPMVDQVLVGSIERSRHPDIKAAVLIGVNDGVFPQPILEDAILNDDDREQLRRGGVAVGVPARSRVLEESMLAYIALTRPSEQVVVTWAVADEVGDTLRPSPYVAVIQAAAPGVKTEPVEDPPRCGETWDILSHHDLTRRVVMEYRERPATTRPQAATRAQWNAWYEAFRGNWAKSLTHRREFAALGDSTRSIALSPELVGRCCGKIMRASVSSLETYATCPFKFFTNYMLRLKERQVRELAPVDIGQIHHAVLEDFIKALASRGGNLGALSDADLMVALEASCRHVGEGIRQSDAMSSARDAYVLSRSAGRLVRIVKGQRAASARGRTKTAAAELDFGFDRDSRLPALTIHTPKGRVAELRGFIDRVDLAELGDEYLGFVIDYKLTRNKKLDMSRVYHGLSLQLLAYLLVLAESGQTLGGRPIRPGGALFVGLSRDYTRVAHPDDLSERDAVAPKWIRPRGLLSASAVEKLDPSDKAEWLDHYQVFRKKTGDFGRLDASDVADDAAFADTLDHVRRRMGGFVDAIFDGEASVRPYRLGTFSPCSWCAFGAACRFELATCDADYLPKLTRTDVLQRVGRSAHGDGDEERGDSARNPGGTR